MTQVIGGPSHHHAAPGPHAMAARHHYHFPVPQPPGAMYPHPAFPDRARRGRTRPRSTWAGGGAGASLPPRRPRGQRGEVNAGRRRRHAQVGARDDKKGNNANNNVNNNAKGKRGKGTKRGAGGGRKSADGKTEDIDDAGSDSMMTGQPGQSDGEVDGPTTEDGEAAAGGARGNGTNKKGSLIPGAPLTKKPRSGQPKQGPKDQSAADILISIMKA